MTLAYTPDEAEALAGAVGAIVRWRTRRRKVDQLRVVALAETGAKPVAIVALLAEEGAHVSVPTVYRILRDAGVGVLPWRAQKRAERAMAGEAKRRIYGLIRRAKSELTQAVVATHSQPRAR